MLARRGFLKAFAAAAVLDPERLLWVPGKKVISIPAAPIYEFNVVLFKDPLTSDGMFRAVWRDSGLPLPTHTEIFMGGRWQFYSDF